MSKLNKTTGTRCNTVSTSLPGRVEVSEKTDRGNTRSGKPALNGSKSSLSRHVEVDDKREQPRNWGGKVRVPQEKSGHGHLKNAHYASKD
jgi:hypothetical protein